MTALLYQKQNTAPTATSDGPKAETRYVIVEPLEKIPEGYSLQLSDLAACSECSTGREYRSEKDAMNHLRDMHYSDGILESAPASLEKVKGSVITLDQLWSHQCKLSSLKLLRDVKDHCVETDKMEKDIAHGVLKDGVLDSSVYRMPSAFVPGFENLVQLVVYAAFVAKAACAKADVQQETSNSSIRLFVSSEQTTRLLILGFGLESSMVRAQHQLILMASTGNHLSRVGFEAIGPESIATVIMNNLQSRLYMNTDKDLLTIFRDCLSKLVRTARIDDA